MTASFVIPSTPLAYAYPLLIKQLLHTPLAVAAEQQIVYRDRVRHDYRKMRERIRRLASALQALGIGPGDTVAVMDWDSHRYLEAYFAVPMMGAVLMTVNVRLSPEQIAYTLNHSGAGAVLVNTEFMPVFQSIRGQLETADRFVVIDDEGAGVPAGFAGEYEALLDGASPDYFFPDFDENTRATTFYTTGTTGDPKGVYFSHRQLVLHTLAVAVALTSAPQQGRVHRDDVYMPITPMFHVHAWGIPFVATMLGLKQVYPGRYAPDTLVELIRREGVTFSHCVPTLMHMLLSSPASRDADLRGWKVIVGGSALSRGLAQAALERGIDVFTGYGMSETCPIVTLAFARPSYQGGRAASPGRLARCGRGDARRPTRRQGGGRDRAAHAVADAGLLQEPAGLRAALGRRQPAHQRHRRHRRGRLPPDHRPTQGRDQNRR
jgi:fatty-acyl-CoA synthase